MAVAVVSVFTVVGGVAIMNSMLVSVAYPHRHPKGRTYKIDIAKIGRKRVAAGCRGPQRRAALPGRLSFADRLPPDRAPQSRRPRPAFRS
ncbi:MAG: hypothetical protein NT090_01800 [Acidobacteria bacterium]|nr:hypothetical protein [Acidobacteriota bacterium]